MTSPVTEPEPLRQRLMPQTSIRFFMFLIAGSALVMYTLRAALVGGQTWAKISSLVIFTAGGCFIAYAALFLLASLFTSTATPLHSMFRSNKERAKAVERPDPPSGES